MPPALPHLLVALAALLRGVVRAVQPTGPERPATAPTHRLAQLRPLGPVPLAFVVGERAIPSRERVLRRALEHRDVRRLLSDLGDRLDARRSRADHADSLAGERHGRVGPLPGVVALAGEVVDAGVVRRVGDRQRPHRADEEARRGARPVMCLDRPALRRFVVAGVDDPRLELDVLQQVESSSDVPEVGEHVGACGLRLGPVPLVHQLLRERVCVERAARCIDPCTRIAVVPPRATDAGGAVEGAHRQAHLVAQVVQRVQTSEAGSDDDGVVVHGGLRFGTHRRPAGRSPTSRIVSRSLVRGHLRARRRRREW